MAIQPDNIYRELQETVAAELSKAGVAAAVQIEPGTAKLGNDALNDSGMFVVVGYPTVEIQENRQALVEIPVEAVVNPEMANEDGFDLALRILGALDERQLVLEWWTALRSTGVYPTGTEDGLVVWTVRLQTRTVQTVDNTI